MKSEWCGYPSKMPDTTKRASYFRFGGIEGKIPKKRMTCPVCKRRLLARIIVDHDGHLCGYRIPRHKVSSIKPRKPSRKTGRARIGRGRS